MLVAPHDTGALLDRARLDAVHASGLVGAGPDEAFDRLAGMARSLLGTPFAFLSVVDDTRAWFVARPGTQPDSDDELPVADSFCRHVVHSGEPLVLGDVRLDPRTRDNPAVGRRALVAWAGFPVRSPAGHVLGTLAVTDTVVRSWPPAEVANLEALAAVATREVALRAALAASAEAVRVATAATAVAEAAAAEARLAHERQALFARIGELLTAGLDLPAVWRAVVRLAVPALADYAFVHAVERDALASQYLLHRDPAQQELAEVLTLTAPRRLTDSSGPGPVARTGVTQLVPDVAAAALDPEQRVAVARLRPTSSISVPLRARGELIGVLSVVRVEGSPAYTADDVTLVETIAARAALALDNALAYHRERRSSVRLQHALLPELLPQPDHVELASRYLPAGRRQLVGGDWYDAFIDGSGSTTLVIGDVAGHDISAAAAMGQLRAMMRMAGHAGRLSPAEVLTAVDATTEGLSTSVFATAVLVQADPAGPGDPPGSLALTWSSAGHPPPVVAGAEGSAVLLDQRPDRPLGLDLGLHRPEAVRCRRDHRGLLLPGETLVLYTDGLVESRDADIDAGTSALLDAVARLAHLPVEDLCGALLDQLAPGRGDDIALLVLRNPVPAAAGGPARMPG